MLPKDHQSPYELDPNNDVLEKGVRRYVEEIAQKNGLLVGKGEGSLLVSSITALLRKLPVYGYSQTVLLEAKGLPGMLTEARFLVEDANPDNLTAIRSEVTLVSEDLRDYLFFVKGQIR